MALAMEQGVMVTLTKSFDEVIKVALTKGAIDQAPRYWDMTGVTEGSSVSFPITISYKVVDSEGDYETLLAAVRKFISTAEAAKTPMEVFTAIMELMKAVPKEECDE